MTRALITGVTGQDGSYLSELLLGEGYEVVGMVRGGGAPDGVEVVRGDLTDPASLRAALAEARPDEVYHLAAPSFVPDSWRDPGGTMNAIAGATATLLATVADMDPSPRILVAVSSEIFGDAGVSPQNEDSPMRPRSPYGVAKLAAHRLVGVMRARHGVFACSVILYNHESPRRPEQFVTRHVCKAAAAIKLGIQDEVRLGDLDAVRDWTFAGDVMRGAWMALQHDEPGDYVLAGGVGRTVSDLVDAAFSHVGLDRERYVRVDPSLVRGVEPTPLIGDAWRARAALGWEPQVSFEDLVRQMVDADLERLSGRGARGPRGSSGG